MLITELTPQFSSNKSYYGKALVITLDNGVRMLKSYETIVCIILPEKEGKVEVIMPWMGWSHTTGNHVWDFLLQNDICVHYNNLGFKSFAAFMREVGQFTWDVKEEKITDIDDNTWVRELQNTYKAIDNFKEL